MIYDTVTKAENYVGDEKNNIPPHYTRGKYNYCTEAGLKSCETSISYDVSGL